MKLRNRKTGKIVKLRVHQIAGKCYESLAEVNEDWEDYEEPKDHWWYIDIHGPHKVTNNDEYYQQVKAASKEIGNYFETKEEAEKAVKKLKAWKRLKDKGVEFYGWRRNHTGTYDLLVRWKDRIPRSYEVKKDLDLLLGDKE